MKAFISFLKDTARDVVYVFDIASKYIANLIILFTPYFMFYCGVKLTRHSFRLVCKEYWVILLVPIALFIIASFMKYYANMIGKGDICPIPNERFTEIDEETGMVSVERGRTQEMLLYVADVEEYLKRKGYL